MSNGKSKHIPTLIFKLIRELEPVTPQNPGVPLTASQPGEFLWIFGNRIPHCCVPFIGIHIFTKSVETHLFGELYLTYNLYNNIIITYLGSQHK